MNSLFSKNVAESGEKQLIVLGSLSRAGVVEIRISNAQHRTDKAFQLLVTVYRDRQRFYFPGKRDYKVDDGLAQLMFVRVWKSMLIGRHAFSPHLRPP